MVGQPRAVRQAQRHPYILRHHHRVRLPHMVRQPHMTRQPHMVRQPNMVRKTLMIRQPLMVRQAQTQPHLVRYPPMTQNSQSRPENSEFLANFTFTMVRNQNYLKTVPEEPLGTILMSG